MGAAGGLGTPAAIAAAFQMGAAYVVTGSVNQSAVEAGLSAEAKDLLAQAGLAALYREADCFVLPSLAEGISNTILEAMASGLPCVVSPSAGGSELIEHEQNGLLIENILDPVSMAQQLGSLIGQPAVV